MAIGRCAHCREDSEVARYRMVGVGIRPLDKVCAARLAALGMDTELIDEADPKHTAAAASAARAVVVGRQLRVMREVA